MPQVVSGGGEQANIVLIGMPGCGKSTVGRALCVLTGRGLAELDRLISELAGMSIPEIFARGGEAEFRELEKRVALTVTDMRNSVIVTGGGIVTRSENYAPLHSAGRIYHIERDVALLERTGRPLSIGADLNEMYKTRLPMYERFRDAVIYNDSTPQTAARLIIEEFSGRSGQ